MLANLRFWPRYISNRRDFIKAGGAITHSHPLLGDFQASAGTSSGHYFHQDLLVAQFIHQNNPERHLDVGSRIDGFVAHVAAFRPIEIFDIRPVSDGIHPNISFIQKDFMTEPDREDVDSARVDSVSCLHTIEHFGLGRYGDTIDPNGHLRGFQNLVRMLRTGGMLYVSFPIGRKNEIHFNAHRVFHPADILTWPLGSETLLLERFDYVDDFGELHKDVSLDNGIPEVTYGCGIYSFRRES